MSEAQAVVAEDQDGELLWFGGGLLTLKVTSEQSGGAVFVLEDIAKRGKTTPLHLHADSDETFYVLEGELLLHVDGAEHTAGPGAVAFIPRGMPHAFLVTSEQARWIAVVTPGATIERFMREAGDPAPERVAPPPEIDIARIKAAGERTGAMQVLGPPPFALAGDGAR
jgi:quercetin dioxygenase-like cupin family protein